MLLCNDDVNEDGKCSLPETDLSVRQCYSVSLLFHYKLKLHQFNSDSNLFYGTEIHVYVILLILSPCRYLYLQFPCHSKPCLNNGICVQDGAGLSFHCVCKAGFAGTRCQGANLLDKIRKLFSTNTTSTCTPRSPVY